MWKRSSNSLFTLLINFYCTSQEERNKNKRVYNKIRNKILSQRRIPSTNRGAEQKFKKESESPVLFFYVTPYNRTPNDTAWFLSATIFLPPATQYKIIIIRTRHQKVRKYNQPNLILLKKLIKESWIFVLWKKKHIIWISTKTTDWHDTHWMKLKS